VPLGLASLREAAATHLSPAGQLQITTALDMLACLEGRQEVLRHQLLHAARHMPGARILAARIYGVGRSPRKTPQLGIAGYPALRIVALAETGTRGLLGAVIGGKGERSEVPLARKLVPLLREGMLLLADRGECRLGEADAGPEMSAEATAGAAAARPSLNQPPPPAALSTSPR
jgi:hypothetical protein